MFVVIEIRYGRKKEDYFGPEALDDNIEALQRCADGKPLAGDFVVIQDTISMLRGVQREIKEGRTRCSHPLIDES
jgi:hypothetical protein